MSQINEPATNWVIFVVLLPLIIGMAVAFPAWWKHRAVLGNLLGSFAIAAVVFVLIWQQYGAYVQAQSDCAQAFVPFCASISGVSQYVPYLMLVLLGWVDVFFLLIISGIVGDKLKPRWFDRSKL